MTKDEFKKLKVGDVVYTAYQQRPKPHIVESISDKFATIEHLGICIQYCWDELFLTKREAKMRFIYLAYDANKWFYE